MPGHSWVNTSNRASWKTTPSGGRVTIVVRPGDQITWSVTAFSHGVVFETQAQMSLFLATQASQPLATRSQFFSGNGFGTEGFGAGTQLMAATIRDVADSSQELDFTCFVHGQGRMNGTLRFE